MRLSEAIRLGAMLKPQGRHWLLFNEQTCALGAACEAVGISIRDSQSCVNNETFKRWPILRMRVEAPVIDPGRHGRASVSITIQSLNDRALWTREQIADWVQGVEETLSTTVGQQPTADAVGLSAVEPVAVNAR